jgi:hypothetical protein
VRQSYLISGTVRTGDGVRLRVVARQAPAPHAVPVEATLEDAYLHALASSRAEAAQPAAGPA